MRNRLLHDALLAFTEEAAGRLAAEGEDAEIPFELVESRGSRRTSLYCYRPLTGDFIAARFDALAALPTFEPAARALEALDTLDAYLAVRGERRPGGDPGDQPGAALLAFVAAAFEDATAFEFVPDRFERAFAQLESALYESRAVIEVIAPVLALALESPEVPIGEGLSLIRGDALPDAPEAAVWTTVRGHGERPNVLAVLTAEGEGSDSSPAASARLRFRKLLTALRLFDDGGFALGPAAWTRADAGAWRMVMLGGSGRPRGLRLVESEQEDELRAFCNLIAKRTPGGSRGRGGGEVAWALSRFELGCERILPFEALTDYLLALRGLLEPEGPSSGRLAQRLASICAVPAERPALAERVAHAVSLERAVIAGLAPAGSGANALVGELASHLRALLRDVLCGHLEPDLVGVADDILASELDELDDGGDLYADPDERITEPV